MFPFIIVSGVIILAIIAAWISLQIQISGKKNALAALKGETATLTAERAKIEELKQKKQEIEQTIGFFNKNLSKEFRWAEKLRALNALLPSQIWLTGISTESEPKKKLTIKGSATSKSEGECIAAITQFVSNLKSDASFSKDFTEIKLGGVQPDNKGNFNVKNFTLYCTRY